MKGIPFSRAVLRAWWSIFEVWLMQFCVNALIGLAAFVSEDVAAYDWIVQKLIFIIGGMLIPIDFFTSFDMPMNTK